MTLLTERINQHLVEDVSGDSPFVKEGAETYLLFDSIDVVLTPKGFQVFLRYKGVANHEMTIPNTDLVLGTTLCLSGLEGRMALKITS